MDKYNGLNDREVLEYRDKYGTNEIVKEKKENIIIKLFKILLEPMFLLLIISASIYFILGEVSDGITMLVFVCFMVILDFSQEIKTSKAIEELNKLTMVNTCVIRNNKEIIIRSDEIVVNDVVVLREGDRVCADGVILECNGLGINESILTGESYIVHKSCDVDNKNKFKNNMVYSGTFVTTGDAIIRVCSVGSETEYGKIGLSLKNITEEKSPLEKQVNKLIFILTIVSVIFFIFVCIVNFVNNSNGDILFKNRIINSILSGITVAMATIPEEIPVVLTVFLAIGSYRLAKCKTLVKKPKVTETLGCVSVLCVDKTGTITKNQMTIKDVYSDTDDIYLVSNLATSANSLDEMDKSIIKYTEKYIDKNKYKIKKLYEYNFNNRDKMMGYIYNINNKKLLCVKGANEKVLSICNVDDNKKKDINNKIDYYTSLGYRVIMVAKTFVSDIRNKIKDYELEYVGLIAFIDPPKDGVKRAIEECKRASVRVIMITGDSENTALAIANQIGLDNNGNVINGEELECISDDELNERVKDCNIFVRVYPEHKMRIVKALQHNKEVVAMTGDGVNDAIALKQANVGIAMGDGCNVAKESADMILLDNNFKTIVSAIRNGRGIYENIRKAISYILIIHLPVGLLSLMVPLFNLPLLLLPIHIVILELIIDPTSSIIFQHLKINENIMDNKPRDVDENILNKNNLFKSITKGIVIFLTIFLIYIYLIRNNYSLEFATTICLSILIISNILLAFSLASDKNIFINIKDNICNKYILVIDSIIIISLLLIIYVPIFNRLIGTCSISILNLIIVIFISFFVNIIDIFFKK